MLERYQQAGLIEQITTEGNPTWVIKRPVRFRIKAGVMAQLRGRYIPTEEIGGVLFARYAGENKTLLIDRFVQLANVLPPAQRRSAYGVNSADMNAVYREALNTGALPIRMHSHPVDTGTPGYKAAGFRLWQRTSPVDQHNAYLPFRVGNALMVMPDALLAPETEDGRETKFYLYAGFISPDYLRGLFSNEVVTLYLLALAGVSIVLLRGLRSLRWFIPIAAFIAVYVFWRERRATYDVDPATGDYIISFAAFENGKIVSP